MATCRILLKGWFCPAPRKRASVALAAMVLGSGGRGGGWCFVGPTKVLEQLLCGVNRIATVPPCRTGDDTMAGTSANRWSDRCGWSSCTIHAGTACGITPNRNYCQKNDDELTLEQVTDELDVDPGIDIVDGSLTANALAQPASAEEQQRGRPLPTCRSMYAPFGGLYRMGVPSFRARRTVDP